VSIAPAPRVVLAERLARRDHLHGTWWPYSADIEEELTPMLNVVGARFGFVRGVRLNREEWPGTPISWQPAAGKRTRISWYGTQEPRTAVLLCGDHNKLVLLVLPPDTPEAVALSATFLACTPGNSLTGEQALHKAASGERSSSGLH
jgi:hypothetical protein